MNLLSLNYDVLGTIFLFTDSSSAMNLSTVSRKAREIGIPYAISNVTLTRSQKQVSQFCQFMLADPQSRLWHMRELIIESSAFGVTRHIEFQRTVDFSASTDLAELLEHTDRLRRLSLACFEGLIAKEPRVSAALCALPDLADVELSNSGQLSLAVLDHLRSSPRHLTFTSLFNKRFPTFFHRLAALKNLEALNLSFLDFSDGSEPYAEVHRIPQMPSLQSLSLRGTTGRMSLFVHALPNLRSLKLLDIYTGVDGESDYLEGGCWSGLDYLSGNIPDFRYWKVRCPVRWLHLDLTAYHYDDTLDIIQRTSPIILSLPVETKVDITFWTRLVSVVPRLRCLELCLDEGRVQKLDRWMVRCLGVRLARV